MNSSTVDLVVTGDETVALAVAVEAVRRGKRVLVVLRSSHPALMRRFRQLCRAANGELLMITNAEVVCVDGVAAVEAVVIRHTKTGRVRAVNASAFLSCDGRDDFSGVSDRCNPGTRARRRSRKIQ